MDTITNWLTPEKITAIATVLMTVAAYIALYSFRLSKKQIEAANLQVQAANLQIEAAKLQIGADHARSRRERAVELMQTWVSYPDSFTQISARRLLRKLSGEQCKKLYNREVFKIDDGHDVILSLFRDAYKKEYGDDSEVKLEGALTHAEMLYLRSIACGHLNQLEVIATAWVHEIADKVIIENAFRKIIQPAPDEFVLDKFRLASGVYPCLSKVVEHLREEQKNRTTAQSKTA